MKFSIVTITHNRAHLIGETIQSVLNQSHTDFEHIIIDDGSTDDTEKIVTGFNDGRIRYYKYQKSGKRSFLRNEGFRKSTGDFISVLDSDDIWKNNKLEVINTIFNKNPNVDFVFHNVGFIPENAVKEEIFSTYKSDFSGDFLNDLLNDKILPFPIFTIKKTSLENIGLIDENMIDGQHDLYLRAAAKLNLYYCSEKLTFMKKHSQNISKNRDMTHYNDYLKSIDKLKNIDAIPAKKHTALKSKMYSKIAYIYNIQKEYPKAKENYIRSFQTNFFNFFNIKSLIIYLKIRFIGHYKRKGIYSELIRKNDVCFDIGANIGKKSKLFLSLGAKVFAFEPQSSCMEKLFEIKSKNDNFDFYPLAVGAKNESKELFLANHAEVATLSVDFVNYFSNDKIYWNEKETVTVKSLDFLIKQHGLPDFCKIDVEGYEFEILSNLTYQIPIIEFEFTGGFINDTLKIIELVDRNGALFNFILNEAPKFELKNWVSGNEIKKIIESLPKERLHGNLFVKS